MLVFYMLIYLIYTLRSYEVAITEVEMFDKEQCDTYQNSTQWICFAKRMSGKYVYLEWL